MSLNTPPTPTLNPTNLNINEIKNISLLKEINNADNLLESQEKSQDNIEHIPGRRTSSNYPEINTAIYQNLFNDHQNRYIPGVNKESLEQINKINDYKWKLGMILIDKINSLKNEISEIRKEIDNKKKEFEKNKVYRERIRYLTNLIEKEESEKSAEEIRTNNNLKKKKKELEEKINEIETNKNNLKATMKKKYQTMIELKEKLNKSLKELLSVEQQINLRKFINEQEESEQEKERKREMSQKLFRKEEELLHLSQNIGEYMNQNLIIKDENNIKI